MPITELSSPFKDPHVTRFDSPTIVSNNPDGTGNLVNFLGHNTCRINGNTGQSCTMEMGIPSDFGSLVQAFVIIAAAAASTIEWSIDTAFGNPDLGELPDNHTSSFAAIPTVATDSSFIEAPIDAAILALAANDLLGITISDAGVPARGNIHVFCAVLRYLRTLP